MNEPVSRRDFAWMVTAAMGGMFAGSAVGLADENKPGKVEALIKKLDDKVFKNRAAAGKELVGIVRGVTDPLVKARDAKSSSAELRSRARSVLKQIRAVASDTRPLPKMPTKHKHACAGMNMCKGLGGCRSSANGCAGKNDCKGKGGCATTARHDCRGKNDCKAQGGCGSGDNGCAGKNSCKGKGGCAVPVKQKKK